MAKKKKVRVAFKKNRSKPARANDLTRRYNADELGKAEPVSGERVRAKGDLSRHRTILTDVLDPAAAAGAPASAPDDAASIRSVDLSECRPGRVIRIHGMISVVEGDDGTPHPCHVRRLLKTLAIDTRNVVTVGDRVWYRPAPPRGAKA